MNRCRPLRLKYYGAILTYLHVRHMHSCLAGEGWRAFPRSFTSYICPSATLDPCALQGPETPPKHMKAPSHTYYHDGNYRNSVIKERRQFLPLIVPRCEARREKIPESMKATSQTYHDESYRNNAIRGSKRSYPSVHVVPTMLLAGAVATYGTYAAPMMLQLRRLLPRDATQTGNCSAKALWSPESNEFNAHKHTFTDTLRTEFVQLSVDEFQLNFWCSNPYKCA